MSNIDEFVKKINFNEDTFADAKRDMNFVLQRLIDNMLNKGSTEGSMTLKLDVTLKEEFIPNFDPDIEGETRKVDKPVFKHKVTSQMQIKDEKSGNMDTEMELVLDDETGEYVMKPIANTTQRSIFDSDYQDETDNTKCVNDDDYEETHLPGGDHQSLPGPVENGDDEDGEDGEEQVGEDESPVQDAPDDFMDDEDDPEDAPDNRPDDDIDDYDYDDPEDE